MSANAFAHSAEFYDALYAGKNYRDEAVEVADLIRGSAPSASSLLDIGSGTGRHVFEFERLGFEVTGVDLAPDMVRLAQERAIQVGSAATFHIGDARSVRMERKFDAVVSLFHVASYQVSDEDVSAYFSTVAHHLKPGGLLVFDFWAAPGVLASPPQCRVRRVRLSGGEVLRTTEPNHRVEESLVDVQFGFHFFREAGGPAERYTEVHVMRYFSVNELRQHLRKAGFAVVSVLEQGRRAFGRETFNGMIVARLL